jgi:DNA-binding CsgD family transcriptional regulator
VELIGRDLELELLLGVLEPDCGPARGACLEGEAGVGKTVLLRQAMKIAGGRGWRILQCAPTRSESRLGFAALGDLLDFDLDELLASLPAPQRAALEVALLRRSLGRTEAALDDRAIGLATLSALRTLAGRGPLLVAIDDLQWVDASSAAVLRFALRRLRDESIAVVATRRIERTGAHEAELERLLGDERVRRIRVEPLSLGAVHELLLARTGFDAPRTTLVRLYELSGGNPFFALEIARELIGRDSPLAPDEALPVPGSVRELVHARLTRLSARTQSLMLATAALARPSRSLLSKLDDDADAAVDEAVAAGLIELRDDDRVRFTHPLVASTVYDQAPLAERRQLHSTLSEVVEDLEERARHLALSTPGVDESTAARLDEAVHSASARGAPQAAAELSDLAAGLTPAGAMRAQRILASAEHHRQAGNLELAGDRGNEALRTGADPETRARALAVLGTVTSDSVGVNEGLPFYKRALKERGASRMVRSDVHHKLAWQCLVAADAFGAQRHARAMMRVAEETDPAAQAAAAATLAHALVARGQPVPRDLLNRALELEPIADPERPWAWSETSPAVLHGVVLLWGGELEAARAPLERVRLAAADRGDPWLEMHALAYLSALETQLGAPRRGRELARRYLDLADAVGHAANRSGALWPLAVSSGWLGDTDEARAAATEGLALAEQMGHHLYTIGNLTALGGVELSLSQPAAAAKWLLRACDLAAHGGIESPARFPMLADAVDALVGIDELKRAGVLARRQREIADRLGRPWVLALAARCEGLVADALGEEQLATSSFERALEYHDRQSRPLDLARTLLAYGHVSRRARRKAAARELLDDALRIFDDAGAAQWAERTRVELGRIGGRRAPARGALSASESAIAELVAAGRTNREVAATLHLSPRTVEWNLSKVYRKLGVRTRTELASKLLPQATAASPVDAPGLDDRARAKSGGIPG